MKTQTKGWVVIIDGRPNNDGVFIPHSLFSETEEGAIKKFKEGIPRSLKFLAEKYGYKCVRATQTIEIDNENNNIE